MLYKLEEWANKVGLIRIAEADEDPDTMQHLWSVDAEHREDPADCGHVHDAEPGRFAPLCPQCADIHADQPWIQRCRS